MKARVEAESLGVAGLAVQVIDHPVGTLTADQVRDLADTRLNEIVFALTAPAAAVEAAYRRT